MKLKIAFLVATIIVTACGSPSIQPPEIADVPPSALPQQPTAIPIIQPTTTSINDDPFFFHDDFDNQLLDGWAWIREDAGNWSLSTTPASLQINVGPGHVHDETSSNILLRPAPTGDFQIETKITFSPIANFQFAGLIIFESPSNLIQAGRAFCEGGYNCVGDGIYVDYYENGTFILPNYAQPYTDSDVIYLRLLRNGNTYTLQTSADGVNWILRGGHVSEINPLQIGLSAGQNTSNPIPVLFDYFEASSIK